VAAETLLASQERQPLLRRVADLRDAYAALWGSTPAELPPLGPPIGLRRHLANARAAARLIDDLAVELARIPEGDRERHAWRESVRERLHRFGDKRLGWPAGYRSLLFGDAFFAAAVAFARDARAFDPELPLDSLWQALRNVWIGNSLQMLLDKTVVLRPGLFAYSMLYPLTDNLLDDPEVDGAAKRGFNERLGRRLAGLAAGPARAGDAAISRLVGRIEEEFPRRAFVDVYESLLAIHRGQVLSLRQQDEPGLNDGEIVMISCEKGGASVLADLYLVVAAPSPSEERFAFGYGVFLQLLDDLQDVESDIAAGHQTLFTRAARAGALDAPTARLARFIDRVLDEQGALAGAAFADRKDLIRRNCRALLVGAVADQPSRFTWRFRRTVAGRWPFSFRAIRRLRHRARCRFTAAAGAVHARTGASSLLDLALAQA
jgi:hypothetical protein